ncbi:MAG: NAD(P)-binding domain-containing protein [Acidobacteriota bacterium]
MPDTPTPEFHHVAIIGAGPIGLELAVALKAAGVDYIQFDAGQIGSTIAWYPLEMPFHSNAERLAIAGVPIQVANQQKPNREEYLAYLRSVVLQFDLKIHTYERVIDAGRLDDGRFELRTTTSDGERMYQCAAVVVAIGSMHAPRLLGIPGEDAPHVSHYFRDPHTYFGQRLLIVGGRNSAIETAVRCQRAGANVTLSYRRGDFDSARVKFWLLPEIRSMLRDDRVRFLPRTVPIEIRGSSAILLATNEDGSPLAGTQPIEVGTDFVLLMTGYRQDASLFSMLDVARVGLDQEPDYDPATMETNVPNVYVAGTAVSGTPQGTVRVIVETCHVHVPRIVGAITGTQVAELVAVREDD